MKEIFGIDITEDKNNEIIDGANFLSITCDKSSIEKAKRDYENYQEIIEKGSFPKWVKILDVVMLFFGMFVVACFIGAFDKVDFRTGMSNILKSAPFLVYGTIFCLVVGIALWIIIDIKEKKNVNKQENIEASQKARSAIEDIYKQLGCPSNYLSVDVFFYYYKQKKDDIKFVGKGLTEIENRECRMFVEDNKLCICTTFNRYDLDIKSFEGYELVKKKTSVDEWNKKEKPNKGIYKQFKIKYNAEFDIYYHPDHYKLLFKFNNKEYCLRIPSYELDNICDLLENKSREI